MTPSRALVSHGAVTELSISFEALMRPCKARYSEQRRQGMPKSTVFTRNGNRVGKGESLSDIHFYDLRAEIGSREIHPHKMRHGIYDVYFSALMCGHIDGDSILLSSPPPGHLYP